MDVIILRPATNEDYDAFYAIKADLNNILWSGFEKAPEKDSFRVWYQNQIANNSVRKLFLLQVGSKVVGYSSVSYANPNEPEISYGVLTEESGKGYGTEIIQRTTSTVKSNQVIAWVSENNKASIRCFEKCGYKKLELTEVRTLALIEESQIFCKWYKNLQ